MESLRKDDFRMLRSYEKQKTAKAWNIATALYCKLGAVPWKLADIRSNVCYIGLTFKQDLTNEDPRYACCAAQMFLDSGDGMVFRETAGPYYNPNTNEYHLSFDQDNSLLDKDLEAFSQANGKTLWQIFIHGKRTLKKKSGMGLRRLLRQKFRHRY